VTSTALTGTGWGGGEWADTAAIPGRDATDCEHLFGDALAEPVRWHGESRVRDDGGPVILHFKLRAAELYGFEWV
jgi:hypothetical protein